MVDGTLALGDRFESAATGEAFEALEVGLLAPEPLPLPPPLRLGAGQASRLFPLLVLFLPPRTVTPSPLPHPKVPQAAYRTGSVLRLPSGGRRASRVLPGWILAADVWRLAWPVVR